MPHSPASDSERMYACQHCPKRYQRKDYLERHELNHTRPQSVCPACGKGFARPDVLRKHLSTSCKSRRGSDGDAPAPLTTAEEDALVPRKRRRPQRRLTNASPTPSSDEDYQRPSKRRTQSYETYPALERIGRPTRSQQYGEAVRGLVSEDDSASEPEPEPEPELDTDTLSTLDHTPISAPIDLPASFAATPETLSLFKADSAPEWRAPWPSQVEAVPEVEVDVEPQPEEGEDLFSWLFPEQKVEVDKVEYTEPPYESYLHAWEHAARARPPSAGTGMGMGTGTRPAVQQAFRPDPWEDWRMNNNLGSASGEARDVMKLLSRAPLQPFGGFLDGLRAR